MIRSKEQICIDPLRRKYGIAYVEVKNKKEDDENGTIIFDVIFRTPLTVVKQMPAQVERTAEDGSKYVESFMADVERTVLVEYRRECAIYRASRFRNAFKDITPEQYDQALIAEIDRVNKLTPTGNEIQTEFFYYEWSYEDLEVVSEEELIQLQTPKILN